MPAAQVAPTGNLYVIHRGLALYGARVLTAGKVWGDDVILMNPENRSPCARLRRAAPRHRRRPRHSRQTIPAARAPRTIHSATYRIGSAHAVFV